jgi:hypothetical protein
MYPERNMNMKSLSRILSTCAVVAFSVAWATPAMGQETFPPAVPHDLAGRDQCLMCHTAGAMDPVPDAPASHEGRVNGQCLWCHATDSPMLTVPPKVIPHALEGMDQCLMCHTPGAMEPVPDAPASHEGRTNEVCSMCHQPAEG